jgi:hypothetical protein
MALKTLTEAQQNPKGSFMMPLIHL